MRGNPVFALALVVFTICAAQYAIRNQLGVTPDELYHYDAIKTYAQQYSPFVTAQTDLSTTNDMIRYTSYLYHYLVSFPYRLLHGIGLSDQTTLIILRLGNVVLGIGTILLLRRTLRVITTKRAANFAAGLFAILPVTMVIFGGLNYDNMLLPIMFGSVWLLASIHAQPRVAQTLCFLALLMVGAITQYKFLPLAFALFCALCVVLFIKRQHFAVAFRAQRFTRPLIAVLLFFALSFGLFMERYGVNIATYHSVNPPCEASHSLQKCLAFPINYRDYYSALDNHFGGQNIIVYAADSWYRNMVRGIIYPEASLLWIRYVIPIVIALSLIAIMIHRRLGYTNHWIGWTVLAIAGFYICVVFAENYRYYVQIGYPYTINGRYLLAALPFVFVPLFTNIRLLVLRQYPRHKTGQNPEENDTQKALLDY